MQISNYEQFKSLLLDEIVTGEELQHVHFSDDFTITLKVKGDRWDGQFDYDIAQLIQRLQLSIFAAYKSTEYEDPRYKRIPKEIQHQLYVKVKLQPGCSLIELKLGRMCEAFFKGMSGTQKLALGMFTVLAICGSVYGVSQVQAEAEIQKKIIDTNEKKALIAPASKAIELLDESYSTIRTLQRILDEKDEVEFVQSGQSMNKPTLQHHTLAPAQIEMKPKKYSVDESYNVEMIDKDQEVIRISHGDACFDSSTSALPDVYIAQIHDVFKEAHLKSEPATMDLRVTVTIKGGRIVDSHIIGTGPKRDDSVPLMDLLNEEEIKKSMPLLELIEAVNNSDVSLLDE